jgi:hypothetical protein
LTAPGRDVQTAAESAVATDRTIGTFAPSPDDFRRETAATWPPSVVEMLLAACRAALGHPAYVTTAVADLIGAPARSFRDWVAADADSFRNAGGHGDA